MREGLPKGQSRAHRRAESLVFTRLPAKKPGLVEVPVAVRH